MAAKQVQQETSEVILNEFRHVREDIGELKLKIEVVASDVISLKSTELSNMKAEIAVLKDRAGRSGAIWGTLAGAVIAAIVSAFFGMLHK